jgi:hypothetical protein
MLTPTTKPASASAIIGCNIRAGMTPGGFTVRLPSTNAERNLRQRKRMDVYHAAMAFMENRVVRTPVIAAQTTP